MHRDSPQHRDQSLPSEDPQKFCLDCGYPLDGLRDPRCPECGLEFDPLDAGTFAVNVGNLVKLHASRAVHELHMLRDMLQESGIRAVVLGETLALGRGELPMTSDTLPAVWVGEVDAQRALTIAREFEARSKQHATAPASGAGEWTCPACGESIEGQFTDCWNCGATRE